MHLTLIMWLFWTHAVLFLCCWPGQSRAETDSLKHACLFSRIKCNLELGHTIGLLFEIKTLVSSEILICTKCHHCRLFDWLLIAGMNQILLVTLTLCVVRYVASNAAGFTGRESVTDSFKVRKNMKLCYLKTVKLRNPNSTTENVGRHSLKHDCRAVFICPIAIP